ncbi:MAG: hydrolase [Caulobacteraceae bacterium]|nr:hydrolase [Caulobacteraceae bacterium]
MNRPVIYLLPGLLCDAAIWADQSAALGAFGDVRVPDFTGFDSIAAMASAVLADGPDRFAVVGHSMGARVALEIARRAPQRVQRLAMLDTGIHPLRPGEIEKRAELVAAAHAGGMQVLVERWLPPMVHPGSANAPFMTALREMVLRMSPEIHERQIKALVTRPETGAAIAAIDCPVLIGVGRQDQWSPLDQHEAMATRIAGARLVVFEDSGHMSPAEAPAQVSAALVEFLGPLAGGAGIGSKTVGII